MAEQPRKVLYIEDDPHIRKLVQLTLEEQGGMVVKVCDHWTKAVKLAESDKPDLFLLDIMLPEKDGVETLRELRKLPHMQAVPAVFLTVDIELSTANTQDLGPYGVIAKPFEVDRLLPTLLERYHTLV